MTTKLTTTNEYSSNSSASSTSSSSVPRPIPSVYIVGGCGISRYATKLLEKFDFADSKSEWIRLKDMPQERSYFAGAVVAGIIYVIGGRNTKKEIVQSIDSYDPATGIWKTHSGLKPVYPRSEFGAAALRGKIFMIGGFGDSSRRVECFDVKRNEISERRSLQRGRWALGVVACRGRIYACGGQWYKYKESDERTKRMSTIYLNDVESYDPVIDQWVREPGMLRRRGYHGLTVHEDSIYAVGGMGGECNQRSSRRLCSIEKFDTYTKQWSLIGGALECSASNLCAVVIESKLFAIGGTRNRDDGKTGPTAGDRPGSNFLSTVEMVDLKGSSICLPPVTSSSVSKYPMTLTAPRHTFVSIAL